MKVEDKEVEEIHPETHPSNVEMSLEWFGEDLCEWSQVVDMTLQLNICSFRSLFLWGLTWSPLSKGLYCFHLVHL